ncbi:MAG: TonB-dependent receptor [Bacteroidetes bacterium]|nr:TonB-dependent receptor [Bacteroidota bacterium]
MVRKLLILFLFIPFCALNLLAQNRMISGKVVAKEDGQSLPGVNVVIQGTTRGATTDANGNFKLDLEATDNTLTVSFIGYKTQTITIGSQTSLSIVLESEASQLQEVVVVGYGVQKKSDITGAVANVKGEEMIKQPVLTAAQAIQGKVAGVQIITSGQPGTSPQIRLRGVSTALGATTALFVVDGVLTDDISNVNTADIVDMNILKDASAAAIYGSRGANGVIIITTRKGVSGKIKVSYNNNVGFRQAANLVPMANSAEYNNYVQAASGLIPPASTYNTDWYSVILRNALEQTHNLSFSGGADKSTFLFNVGYMDDNGIVINNNFKRLTMRLNSDYKLTDNLKLGIQSSFASSANQNGFGNLDIDPNGNVGSVYNDAYRAAPIIPSIVNGRYGNSSIYQNVGNPLLDINSNSVKVLENRLQGSSYLEYKPVVWLTLKTSFGADWRNSLNRLYNYQIIADNNTYVTPGGNQQNPLSSLNVKNTQSFRWVWDNTATFSKNVGKHGFTFLVGTTAEKYRLTFVSAFRKSVPADPNLWYIGVGDANTSQNDGGGDMWARNSYLGRLNYSYDGRYLLTATLRRDGSSRLPIQNRWQNYPSVGAAWVLSNEKFMEGQTWFDLLKLRASYGRVGNDQIPTNAYTQTVALNQAYPFLGSGSTATNGAQINQIIDPNITWEITDEYDVATEFSMLHSKLSGEINYYNKTVHNALISVPIPRTVGDADGLIITNAASIQNKGVEIALNWRDAINTNLSYSIGGNITLNTNQVTALNGGQNILDGYVGNQGAVTNTDIGHPVGSFYVLKQTGVFNSDAEAAGYVDKNGVQIQPSAHAGDFKYLDAKGSGPIDINKDRVFVGSYQPKAYYGINGSIKYKNWDFSLTIYGNTGNQVYNGKRGARYAGTDNIEKALVYNRWTPVNHTQTQPAANGGNLPASTYFVESGSFVRINNVTIGYTFSSETLQRLKISTLRVYVVSQNPYTYKKYSGFTSELPGGPTNSGIELSTYPTTRTIAAGISLGF